MKKAMKKHMGKKETFKGKLKQTEGYTPKSALPSKMKAGGAKAREKRLEKFEM